MGTVRNSTEFCTVEVLRETDKAYLFNFIFADERQAEEHWIPKSCVHKVDAEDKKVQQVEIDAWVLKKREIIE